MVSLPLAERDQLIAALQDAERSTAAIFMGLAETLPALVSEMKRSVEHAEASLVIGGGESADVSVHDVASEARQVMNEGITKFRTMYDADGALFRELREGITRLNSITDSIKRIRLDSEDMELVSLNAMTVALKAGNAGRAFSYITEELKRLANKTISLAESISAQGTQLLGAFTELETSLNDTRAFETDLIESFEHRILGSFEDYRSGIDETLAGMEGLHQKSQALVEPVNGMMQAIQLQDLIRQSIDHIILALEAIKPEGGLTSPEELLDELAFIRQIPDLANSLIADVVGQISKSVETFAELNTNADSLIQELEQSRAAFLADGSAADDEENKFTRASRLVQGLLDDLNRNMGKKQALVARSGGIIQDVAALDRQFRKFETYVNRFKSIDIASRIEIAKQEVLRQMGTSSNEMNALTRKIESDVADSLEATEVFISSISEVIATHQRDFKTQHAYAEDFGAAIRSHYAQLELMRDRVQELVQGFSLFTDGFHGVFDASKRNGQQLANLCTSLSGLSQTLDRMRSSIETSYQEKLTEHGATHWTIGDDRLQSIIQRFTIFDHKQRAGEIAGFEVEEGAQAGDVTLF